MIWCYHFTQRVLSIGHFSDEQVLGKLLAVYTATRARGHRETGVQQPGDGLNAVELTVSIQWKPDQVSGVHGRPGHRRTSGWRFQRWVARFGEHLVQDCVVTRQHHPLPEVRTHVNRHAFVLVFRTGEAAVGPARAVWVPTVCPVAFHPVSFQVF